MIIDLHCHTKLSDGSTSIDELIELAKLRKIDVLSVTDHDTFAGSIRAGVVGKRGGITVVPGVEVSAIDPARGKKVHILCYFPKVFQRMEGMLKKITDNRKSAMTVSVQKVLRLYPLPVEMILTRAHGSTNIFKQHIMQALMDAGYTDELFGRVFQKLFHTKYGLAYTEVEYPSVEAVLGEIREAGGVAVLAHPSEYESMELMVELCEKNLIQGVELHHPRNTEEDRLQIEACCKQYGKAMTGGTDFHGFYTKICNPPGSYLTEKEQFDILKKMTP